MSDVEKDPVVHSSLSKALFISSMVLVLAMGWALYDEVYGTRPWKGYQARFVKAYGRFLHSVRPGELALEKQIRSSPEYLKLEHDMAAAEKSVAPQAGAIDREINTVLVPQILALNEPFQEVRSHIGSLTYQIETSHSDSHKNRLRAEIEEIKKEVHTVKLPNPDGSTRKVDYTFATMDRDLQAWKDRKA